MTITNNVTRMLDARGIRYLSFEVPAEKLSAVEVAELLGLAPEVVFKTIVITREKPARPLLVLVPGESTVDLKKVAAAIGDKKVHLPSEREAEGLTGLQAGGISALALLNKGFRVLIDSSARSFQTIHVSGGQRGLNLEIGVDDLAALTKARFVSVSSPPLAHAGKSDQASP
jgi:Cys-tRNA(Pro)/Cys-tRNA(Cys) deacylase